MRIFFSFIILLGFLKGFTQNRWNASFNVKPNFTVGETQRYKVKEFFKVDNIFIGFKSSSESIVTFRVVDTSNGGHWIRYTMNALNANSKKDNSVFVMNELMDGIQLYVFVKEGKFLLDSLSYHRTRKRVANMLDSIFTQKTFDKNTSRYINYLQAELQEEAGLGNLLAPLLLWEQYYSSLEFKKFRLTSSGEVENILDQKQFSGSIDKEWVSTTKDNIATLEVVFTGDPVAAARYHKVFYEKLIKLNDKKTGKLFFPPQMIYIDRYLFKNTPFRTFPISLSKKNVTEYFFRSVVRIQMNSLSYD